MKQLSTIFIALSISLLTGCSEGKLDEKGFQVSTPAQNRENNHVDDLQSDSLSIETRPSNVLLTGIPQIRITNIYKVNLNRDTKTTFIGSNCYHQNYSDFAHSNGNNWNYNFMPGIEATFGYNMVNVSLYDLKENKKKLFFEKPVLVRTLYYPTSSKDTLNTKPVHRDYFMVSVYNEDTNKDGFINVKDLRRFYLFDWKGERQKALVPENYSTIKSEYDPENDLMYVFAQLDANNNGRQDSGEPIHIFWVDLKDPHKTGQLY
ncbi:hypothetical protein [Bacteroides sp. 224]|uniref:hypothetical protein n=1 Tax=Bacteroides sp. 224 TaxID=2302936 RepID=UPI0013D726E6|nr:hypothetical protein [Bacteroides sp. 224]NDV64607.1 hypothetical protein [Bacteroides sp. 224]